jgi:HSP20 family protein
MALTRLPSPVIQSDLLRRATDRLLEDPWLRPMSWLRHEATLWPRVDVYSTDEEHVVEAALPGVKPDDVKVTLEGEVLTIRASYKHAADRTESGYSLHELHEGEFCRSLSLPGGIRPDRARARFEDGLLKVTVPRAEESKPRRIEVKVS